MIDACIAGLLRYAEDTGLIEADDRLLGASTVCLRPCSSTAATLTAPPAELPLA